MQRLQSLQPSFAAGVLSPAMHGRVDFDKFASGLAECKNFFVRAQGGAYNRAGLEMILDPRPQDGIVRAARGIPFSFNTEQTYSLIFTHLKMFVVKDGEPVVEASKPIVSLMPGTVSSHPTLEVTAHGCSVGDLVYVNNVTNCFGGPFRVVSVPDVNNLVLGLLYAGVYIPRSSTWTLGTSPTIERVYSIATPYTFDVLFDLRYTQSADVMTICHPKHAPRKLTRTAHDNWTLSTPTYGSAMTVPGSVAATPTGAGSTVHRYKVTAVSAATGEESIGSSEATASNAASLGASNYNTVTWGAVSGAQFYYVYKFRGGVFGYVGTATGTSFVDDGIIADQTDTPPDNKAMFAAVGDYPACATFYQQRLSYGGSDNGPQKIDMSQSGNFYNHNVSTPSKDDDGVSFTLVAAQVNRILHLVPLKDLLVFTSGGEWLVRGASEEVVTPSSIYARPQGTRGSSNVAPLVIGDTVLFTEPNGRVVRDFKYALQSDGFNGNDLTVLADHLFKGARIVDWCYQQYPSSIVWVALSNGKLLGLTYMQEHDVWAWHEHETNGLVKSVWAVREGQSDVVYAVVERSQLYGGAAYPYLFVERMDEREASTVEDQVFLDSCYVYEGDAIDELDGLDWLEGLEVTALVDGSPHPAVRVVDAKVTLQAAGSRICIGLPYRALLKTLPLNPAAPLFGRERSLNGVKLRVLDTGGTKVGTELDDLEEDFTVVEAYDEAPLLETKEAVFTLTSGWEDPITIFIVQDYPLPCNVLGFTPRMSVGG